MNELPDGRRQCCVTIGGNTFWGSARWDYTVSEKEAAEKALASFVPSRPVPRPEAGSAAGSAAMASSSGASASSTGQASASLGAPASSSASSPKAAPMPQAGGPPDPGSELEYCRSRCWKLDEIYDA